MSLSVVIAAGGTGGHLVPALAVAAAARRMRPDARIAFLGGRRGMEQRLVPAAGYPIHATGVRPFGGGLRGALAALSLPPAIARAGRVLRREGARAVLGMGGYPSAPAMISAHLLRVPSLLHEQNAVPGLANEMAARFTNHIAVSFPQTLEAFRARTPRLVGVPVREEIARADRDILRPEALRAFGLDPARRTVLMFGGSLGAARINETAIELAGRWRDRGDVQVLLATGSAHHAAVAARLGDAPVVRVEPYLERMDLAYAAADVAVCRAGASTLYELAAVGLPAVLVPYPHARRREQDANARLLADAGAAEIAADDALDGAMLEKLLDAILSDEGRRAHMASAARGVARPDAAGELAGWLLELAEANDD